MQVRRAKIEDVQAIVGISREFGYEPTAADVDVNLRDLLPRTDHAVFIAEIDGAVQG